MNVVVYTSKCLSCGSQHTHYAALKRKLGEANYKVIDTNIDHYFTGSDIEMVKAEIAEHIRIMDILGMPKDQLHAVVDEWDGTDHKYSELSKW